MAHQQSQQAFSMHPVQNTSPFMSQTPGITASGTQIMLNNTKQEMSLIVQTDPTMIGGYRLIYDRKCPFTLHVVDEELIEKVGHAIEQDEELQVKISVKGPDESPEVVKVELFSLKDYFFVYVHTCDVFDYQEMRELQGLNPQFADYLTMLIKLFNSGLTTPDTFKLQIQLHPDNSCDLFFNQILPYKQLSMLGCHFEQLGEEKIFQHIKFRHQMAKLNLEQMEAKLAQICKTIKEKNPSLIQHICKEVQAMRPYGQQLDFREIKKAKSGPRSNRSRTSGRSKVSRSRRSAGSVASDK